MWHFQATSATRAFCEKLVEDAAKALGGLDIFVSNAGRQQQAERFLTSPRKASTRR